MNSKLYSRLTAPASTFDGTAQPTQDSADEVASKAETPVTHGLDFTQRYVASEEVEVASNYRPEDFVPWGATERPSEVKWIVKNLIQADADNSLVGDPGVGKTTIALYLALCVSAGRSFMDRETAKGAVIYVNDDDTEALPRRNAEFIACGMGLALEKLPLYYFTSGKGSANPENGLLDEGELKRLTTLVTKVKPILVIIDSFSSAFPSLDGNRGPHIVRMYRTLQQVLAYSPGAALVVLDHTSRKGGSVAGSQQKLAQVRSVHRLSKQGASVDQLRWDVDKLNGAPPQSSFVIVREQDDTTMHFSVGELLGFARAPKAAQALETALALVRAAGDAGIARKDLIDQVTEQTFVSRRTVEGVVNDEVRPHPNVTEFQLPGPGSPKGYRWSEESDLDHKPIEPAPAVSTQGEVMMAEPVEHMEAYVRFACHCPKCTEAAKETFYHGEIYLKGKSSELRTKTLTGLGRFFTKGFVEIYQNVCVTWPVGTKDYTFSEPASCCGKHWTTPLVARELYASIPGIPYPPMEKADELIAAYNSYSANYAYPRRVKSEQAKPKRVKKTRSPLEISLFDLQMD